MSSDKVLYLKGLQQGKADELRRIVRLLEEYEVGGSDPVTFEYIRHEELMDLIKGGNN